LNLSTFLPMPDSLLASGSTVQVEGFETLHLDLEPLNLLADARQPMPDGLGRKTHDARRKAQDA